MTGEYREFPHRDDDEPLEPERLILTIHDLYRAAMLSDEQEFRRAVEIAESGLTVEARLFVVPVPADAVTLENSDQLRWEPKVEKTEIGNIKSITARIPQIPDKEISKPEGVHSWNDVFFQIERKKGRPLNYLLNVRGLIPFRDGEAIIYNTEIDENGVEHGKSADLFDVEYIDRATPLLSPSDLFLILRNSELQRQSIE